MNTTSPAGPYSPSMSPPAFVGRAAELQQLESSFRSAHEGAGRLVVVAGETGIGKSTLVREFVNSAATLGTRVAIGGVGSGGLSVPYAPFVEAMRRSIDDYGQHILDHLPAHQRRELGRLVPEADPAIEAIPAEPAAELGQLRLFEAVLGWSRNLATDEAPGVLVIEDIHWADTSSGALTAYLAHAVTSARVLVVATTRIEDLEATTWLRRLMLELARRDAVAVIELQPLSAVESRSVAARMLGAEADEGLVDLVVGRSGGNPYFAEELARVVAAGGRDLPPTLQSVIRERLRDLPPPVIHVLQLAGAHGLRGPIDLLQAAAQMPVDATADAIRKARRSNLLDLQGEMWTFRHPLVLEVMDAELMPAERRQLHRALAEALSGVARDLAPSPDLAVALARHWFEAGSADDAFPALLAAAGVAEERHAFAEAHELYERALGLAPQLQPRAQASGIGFRPRSLDEDLVSPDVLLRAAQAASYAGRPERAVDLIDRSIESAASTDQRALLSERLGRYLLEAGDAARCLSVYQLAIQEAEEGPTETRARLLAGYARALLMFGQHETCALVAERAVETAAEARSTIDEFQARATLGACLTALGRVADGMRELEAARRLEALVASPSRLGSSRIVDLLSVYFGTASALDRAGRPEASVEVAREGRATAERLGVRGVWGGLLGSVAASELFDLGRWAEAEEVAVKLAGGDSSESAGAHVVLARLALARGQSERAEAELLLVRPEALHAGGLATSFYLATAEFAEAQGDLTGARGAIEEGLGTLVGSRDELAIAQLAATGLRLNAERAAAARLRRASADLVDLRRDSAVLRAMASATEDTDTTRPTKRLAFSLLAHSEFDRVEAISSSDRWDTVASAFEQLGAPYVRAYARLRSSESLLSDGRSRRDAEHRLRDALDVANELGAMPLVVAVRALARRGRLDLESGDAAAAIEREASPAEQLGLSRREFEVLELLVIGRTNREIAGTLFITEKTAGHHVSSILGKLGVRGRVEAAAAALRLGIGETG